MNQCTFTGNLGRDPELNYTPSGKAVVKFSIAVNEHYGGDKQSTMWLTIVAWDKMAENMNQYLEKGKKVLISGRLTMRKYTDKTGVERQAVELVARDFEILTPKSASASSNERDWDDDPLGELDDHPF